MTMMHATSFSGLNIVFGMDHPVIVPSKPRSAFNSPLLRALNHHVEDMEPLDVSQSALNNDALEPILRENPNRFTLFPIMKPKLFQKYKNHVSVFWTPEEIDLAKDMKDWVKLNENERHFIKMFLDSLRGQMALFKKI